MKRTLEITVGTLVLAIALAGCAGGGRSADQAGAKRAADAVDTNAALLAASDVGRVVTTDLAAGVPVSGTLTPAVDVKISAPLAETIEEVLVKEGQAVAKGQVLARFRTDALEPMAKSNEAQLAVATADYQRQKNLFAEGAVSKHDVESAEAQYNVAKANAAAAGKKWRDATVRAPIAGVISVKSVSGGDRPGDGDPMFELVNTSELDFEATVPSQFVPQIHVGAPVRLTVTGFPTGSVTGRVARVNAAVDPATRQVKVYVRVPNPGSQLVGGLFASGAIVTQEAKAALAAPTASVRSDAAGQFAMIVANGRLARRDVRAGMKDEARDLVQIVSGLAAGDVVVTGPIEGLTPGRAVQIGGKES